MSLMNRLPRLFKAKSMPVSEMQRITESFAEIPPVAIITCEQMSQCIELIPLPICLIDNRGKIKSSNKEFIKTVYINTQEKQHSSLLESIVQTDLDRFYTCMNGISSAKEATMDTCEKCYTFVLNVGGEKSQAYFDWSFSVSGYPDNFIVVTGRPSTGMSRYAKSPKSEHLFLKSMSSSEMEGMENDVSKRQHAQLQLKDERKKSSALRETLEIKRLFVRSVSHEIRTPLNVVLSGLSLFQDTNELSVENSNLLEDIKFSCMVAINILNDLLMYEKLEGNLYVSEKTLVDVMPIVRSVCDQFQVQARYSQINLELIGDVNYYIEGNMDQNKIAQVLRNLVSNAVKFTPAHGHVTVVVKLLEEQKKVRIEVLDTGPGISKENIQRLFKEVVQFSPNELQNGQGSGLGLYISKKVVDMHSGVLGAHSEGEGQGSLFFMELPIETFSLNLNATPPRRRLSYREISPQVSSESDKPSVLIVDDDAICRKLHTRIMTLSSAECTEASNGKEAIDRVRESMDLGKPFDGILLDSSMPQMNGTTAAQLIREMGFKGKIFGVTGNAYKSDIDDFIAHGADEVCIKPLSPSRFSQILESLHTFKSCAIGIE